MATYKIFCDRKQSKLLPMAIRVQETYPAFCVVQASDAEIKKLRNKFPTEKLASRIKKKPSGLAALKSLAKNKSKKTGEYRVQFKAPVRKSWLKELNDAGGKVVDSLGSSAVLVKCSSEKALKAVQEHGSVKNIDGFSPTINLGADFVNGLRAGKLRQKNKSTNPSRTLPKHWLREK